MLTSLLINILNLDRYFKKLIFIVFDIFILFFSFILTFLIIYNNFHFEFYSFGLSNDNLLISLLSIFLNVIFLYYTKEYNLIRRYLTYKNLFKIFAIIFFTNLLLIFFNIIYFNILPPSFFLVNCSILISLSIFFRIIIFLFLSRFLLKPNFKTAVIYGAGNAGLQVLTILKNSNNYRIIGFIDDNIKMHNLQIMGYKIYSLKYLLNSNLQLQIDEIFIAIPSLHYLGRKKILESLKPLKKEIKILPALENLEDKNINIFDIKKVDIDDLIGRKSYSPNTADFQFLKNKIILVTGAGGSIGSEIVNQLVIYRAQKIILYEQSEFNLYNIMKKLAKNKNIKSEIFPVLGSLNNFELFSKVLKKHAPEIIYHAAAYKHVDLVEKNIFEGVINNIFGTLILAKSAVKFKVKNCILISSDKAAEPLNVMGITKKISEMIFQSISLIKDIQIEKNFYKNNTLFSCVRFGNVFGSSGSVVPLFIDQINQGGPITITDKEATRYFMNISEAVSLVILSSKMILKNLNYSGKIFLLEMGKPIKIFRLAETLAMLNGKTIKMNEEDSGDILIKEIGLKKGEKLNEILFKDEKKFKTEIDKIYYLESKKIEWFILNKKLNKLYNMCEDNDNSEVLITNLKEIINLEKNE